MVASATEAEMFSKIGATAFIVSSDQGLMRQAAIKLTQDFSALKK
jgi:2-keto-3-deoxy-L-rhamnonate aldolase RhmA